MQKPQLISRLSYNTRWHLLLLPYGLGILLLVVIPALLSFSLAFFHYDGLSKPVGTGTLNFVLAYTDELFALSIRNSLALILIPVPLRVLGAFFAARLMQSESRFTGWFRAAVYLPTVVPGAAFALAWLWILNPLYGPLNLLLGAFGLTPPAWLADPVWAKPGLALMALWQIGEGFLVSLAALYDIPDEIEDAARIDGAGAWPMVRYILLPLIAPILLLLTFRDAIFTFQESFTHIYFMTQGGPYYATFTLPLFIYEQGFGLRAFGTAGAALWVLYAITGLIVVALYIIAKQWNIGTTDETFIL
jgi:multiple sugar transport system permease protein